jgi:hypothetical protein
VGDAVHYIEIVGGIALTAFGAIQLRRRKNPLSLLNWRPRRWPRNRGRVK